MSWLSMQEIMFLQNSEEAEDELWEFFSALFADISAESLPVGRAYNTWNVVVKWCSQ